jgi:hypothetical protein
MLRVAATALAVLFIFVDDADAQAVYRCVEKGKPVSFQTEPCSPAATISKIREFDPEPEPSAYERRVRAYREAKGREDSAYLRQLATGGSAAAHVIPQGRSASQSQCENARRQRDQWERTAGLNRSYDSVRAMNAMVAKACN